IFFAWREGTFPLTLSAAPLLLLAAWGMFLLVENRQRPALAVSLVFSGQIVLILSYYFITARFAAEFLPLLFFLALAAVRFGRATWNAAVCVLLPVAALVTLGSTFSWHMFYAKPGMDIPESWWHSLNRTVNVDPLRVAPLPGEDRYDVSLMPCVEIHGSPADVARGRTHDGGALTLFARTFALAIGLQFGGSFTVTPPNGATRLVGVLALPDRDKSCFARDAVLRVATAAGATLFESARIRGNFDPTPLAVDLPPDAGPLTIALVDTDGRHECDYLNFLSLQFVAPSRQPAMSNGDSPAPVALATSAVIVDSSHPINGIGDVEGTALQLDGVMYARGFSLQAPT